LTHYPEVRSRLQARILNGCTPPPQTIQAQVEDSISVSTRDAPHVSLEEFDGYEIVVRIRATPVRSEHGARLAGDVLAAVTTLRQNAGLKASVGAPSG
jgi:small conductance mechanosensitive channel